jgi:hypothetical protein
MNDALATILPGLSGGVAAAIAVPLLYKLATRRPTDEPSARTAHFMVWFLWAGAVMFAGGAIASAFLPPQEGPRWAFGLFFGAFGAGCALMAHDSARRVARWDDAGLRLRGITGPERAVRWDQVTGVRTSNWWGGWVLDIAPEAGGGFGLPTFAANSARLADEAARRLSEAGR